MKTTIIDVCSYDFKKSMNQSNTFTRQHVRYDVTIIRNDTHQALQFEYQCNPRVCKIKKDDLFYCVTMDAYAYELSGDDIQYFADMYGYEKIKPCLEAFNACKEMYNKLITFCGSEMVYEWLKKHYENY